MTRAFIYFIVGFTYGTIIGHYVMPWSMPVGIALLALWITYCLFEVTEGKWLS